LVEVLIAGAGPAGSVAATILARAGLRVLLVDRARFPRDKLCGDSVNPGTLAALDRLGLGAEVRARGLPVEGMLLTGPRRVRVIGRYGAGIRGRIISRRDLDGALLAHAVRAGAHFQDEVVVRSALVEDTRRGRVVRGVSLRTPAGSLLRVPACVTIAADGRHSTLAFTLGLARHPARPRRWAVGAYFEGVEGLGPVGEMHVRQGLYVGVAPLGERLANACVVTADRAALRQPFALLESVLSSDDLLGPRFARARMASSPLALGPLAVETREPGMPGLLLAGDAAGFIDPMTGDGLRFAVRGGELAAAAALEMLQRGTADGFEALRRRRRAEFGGKWRFNRALRLLAGSPTGVRAAALSARLAPAGFRRLIRIAGDAT
jgi:flavin-dependent dehydrogenase